MQLLDPLTSRRRHVLKCIYFSLISSLISRPPTSFAVSQDNNKLLLEIRLEQNLMTLPPYAMESTDVFYPSYFYGTWDVTSTLSSVEAPCGEVLFGGDTRLQKAIGDIGSTLTYRSRFIQSGDSRIIADREFNVQEIAKASMGDASVLDIHASSNLVSCTLYPKGSDQILHADLVILARRQENTNETTFTCSEVSQQIISTVEENEAKIRGGFTTPNYKNRQLKQIETISTFTSQNTTTEQIHCIQRTATFLVPSQQDPIALQLWQATQGRPIDVRFYTVLYSKNNNNT